MAVRRIREELKLTGSAMAHNALGADADEAARTAYIDRLSKLERCEEGHRNPTLERLEKLASGMKLPLSSLFARIEALQMSDTITTHARPAEPSAPPSAPDERTPPVELPHDPGSLDTAMAVIKYLTGELVRSRADAEMRRSSTGHHLATSGGPEHRVSRARRDRRGKKTEKRGKKN